MPSPHDASAVLYRAVEALPAEARPEAVTRALNETLEAGEYEVAADLARRFKTPETITYSLLMGYARQRGDDTGLVFALV